MHKRNEAEFRKRLSKLSDKQIKKFIERVEVFPFPILLVQEYTKRFGTNYSVKNNVSQLPKTLAKEKTKQRRLSMVLKTEIKKFEDCRISQKGLQILSDRSVTNIHHKTDLLISAIQQNFNELEFLLGKSFSLKKP